MSLRSVLTGSPDPLPVAIVTTKTGGSIKGLLVRRLAYALVLRNARVASLDQNGRIIWTEVAGEVVIPADNVDYWQRDLDAALLEG